MPPRCSGRAPGPNAAGSPPRPPRCVVGLLIGLGVLFAWRHSGGETAAGPAARPCSRCSRSRTWVASEDEYFADGVTDAVRGKLAAIPGVQVIARSSSVPYKKADKSPQQIARELGARLPADRHRAVGEGRGRRQPGAGEPRAGRGARRAARRGPGGRSRSTRRSPTCSRSRPTSPTRVAQALGATLGSGERKALAEKPTRNLAAYDAYLKARGDLQRPRGHRPGPAAPGARLLRAGGGARLQLRARVGPALPGTLPSLRPGRADAGERPSGAGRRAAGRCARAPESRGPPGHGQVL